MSEPSTSVGRKLPRQYENPIDNVLTDIAEKANPYFYWLGFVPNHITCLSAAFGVGSAFLLAQQSFYLASACFMISYFFDVADGNYARTYNMVSDIGDILDHGKDILVVVSLFWVILFELTLPLWMYVTFLSTQGVALIGMYVYIGAQETYYEQKNQRPSESKSLYIFRNTIWKSSDLRHIRWFGCGSHAVVTSVLMCMFGLCA